MSSSHDLMGQIAAAGARIDPRLSSRDVERLVAGAGQRLRRRRARRVALTAGATCTLALALVVGYRHFGSPRAEVTAKPKPALVVQPQTPSSPAAEPILRLTDGSTAIGLDPTTEIAVSEDQSDRVELVLTRGRGRFAVKPRHDRAFVVHAGKVTVSALGTLFLVERVADRVGVSVESGTVRVDWGVGSAILEESDSGWYPPLVIGGLSGGAAGAGASPSSAISAPHGSSREGSLSPVATKTESAADLLVAADKARVSGHAEQAAELLRRLLREHRADARAPLAAFTLGRMLLIELARPVEAASAFADARRLSPGGPFAEDALAREVEAYNKAGVPAQAHALAQEYLRLYPEGRRATIVKAMGGIK